MDDLKYWVALNRIPGIGTVRFRALEKHFGSLRDAWIAHADELKAAGLDQRSTTNVLNYRSKIDPDIEAERLSKLKVKAITWHDNDYPQPLKEIYDPPPVLYFKGSLLPQDERSIAVVGTRRSSTYGKEACAALTFDLAKCGVTIVSGLARGIDASAHKAALDAGGRTIAIFGCGVDTIYPPEHQGLAKQILDRGACVSEYPIGTRPEAQNFPRRNRLMSGMTLGTLVVEAPIGSGTMWTVLTALEQGREVFAVPGSIFSPASHETNRLIQDGAKLVTSYKDILEELNLSTLGHQPETQSLTSKDPMETLLLQQVTMEPIHIDALHRLSGLPISTVSSTLAMMEVKGLVKQVRGMHYTRTRETASEYRPS